MISTSPSKELVDKTIEVLGKIDILVLNTGIVGTSMFADVDADIYIMVDGDGTYDSTAARRLVQRLTDDGLDMVNCARLQSSEGLSRRGHKFGNRLLTGLVARVFGKRLGDMLSGYRAMSRRFVKSFPA